MSTAANVKSFESGHWYTTDGKACYEVMKKDGKGMTPTTLAHARKLNLIPSVTTILKILDKPALTAWKIEQAVLAVMTSPRIDGEADDAFIKRVLSRDKEQDGERDAAAKLGTDIHAAIEAALSGSVVSQEMAPFVLPVTWAVKNMGEIKATEVILVGDGYAGRTDVIIAAPDGLVVADFKSSKSLPKKESYIEHRLQLSAYAKAIGEPVVRTVNIYISTTEPGAIKVCVNSDPQGDYVAFSYLVKLWQWMNDFVPNQAEEKFAQECSLCHNFFPISEVELSGGNQVLCERCKK